MSFEVLITLTAERDLRELHEYALENDGPEKAERVLDRIVEAVASLDRFPDRGAHPPELLHLGNREFRQIVAFPYRIIYRVIGERVFIDLVADGRRDMQALLTARLISFE